MRQAIRRFCYPDMSHCLFLASSTAFTVRTWVVHFEIHQSKSSIESNLCSFVLTKKQKKKNEKTLLDSLMMTPSLFSLFQVTQVSQNVASALVHRFQPRIVSCSSLVWKKVICAFDIHQPPFNFKTSWDFLYDWMSSRFLKTLSFCRFGNSKGVEKNQHLQRPSSFQVAQRSPPWKNPGAGSRIVPTGWAKPRKWRRGFAPPQPEPLRNP